ncbi:MAG: hypothetical protein LV481_01500 [Methylacidiphilales bacterium]|nr:hypothetical protein [Candidatus Methylacidiphilales bacterium]
MQIKSKPMCWRVSLTVILAWILTLPLSFANLELTLQQRYLEIFLKLNDGEQLERQRDYRGALKEFEDCYAKLAKIYEEDPDWEPALIFKRMDDCKSKILELQSMAAAQPPEAPIPGALSPAQAMNSTNDFVFTTFTKKVQASYPWRKDIVTTEFWIGEPGSTASSAWDKDWVSSNNGADSPTDRLGYLPAAHAPTVNPFYVALPFNDLAYPDKARRWLPEGWERQPRDGKQVSVCKDRWVEIKNEKGNICYAQWEDVGPLRNDHAEYVFGDERPGPDAYAGLNVSPAVAKYLHIDLEGKNQKTSWRFVDAEDVPPGYWLKYDEEAVIFAAMHHPHLQGINTSAP